MNAFQRRSVRLWCYDLRRRVIINIIFIFFQNQCARSFLLILINYTHIAMVARCTYKRKQHSMVVWFHFLLHGRPARFSFLDLLYARPQLATAGDLFKERARRNFMQNRPDKTASRVFLQRRRRNVSLKRRLSVLFTLVSDGCESIGNGR